MVQRRIGFNAKPPARRLTKIYGIRFILPIHQAPEPDSDDSRLRHCCADASNGPMSLTRSLAT